MVKPGKLCNGCTGVLVTSLETVDLETWPLKALESSELLGQGHGVMGSCLPTLCGLYQAV